MVDREKSIRVRAYEIWESEGRPEGRESQHWEQARMQLAETEDRVPGKDASKAVGSAAKAGSKSKGKTKATTKVPAGDSNDSEMARNVSVLGEKPKTRRKRTQS